MIDQPLQIVHGTVARFAAQPGNVQLHVEPVQVLALHEFGHVRVGGDGVPLQVGRVRILIRAEAAGVPYAAVTSNRCRVGVREDLPHVHPMLRQFYALFDTLIHLCTFVRAFYALWDVHVIFRFRFDGTLGTYKEKYSLMNFDLRSFSMSLSKFDLIQEVGFPSYPFNPSVLPIIFHLHQFMILVIF